MAGNDDEDDGIIGAITAVIDETDTVDWRIPDIFSIREFDVSYFNMSLPFDCMGLKWFLEIHPNVLRSEGIIFVRIRSFKPHPPRTLRGNVGIRTGEGTNDVIASIAIPGNSDDAPIVRLLEWSDLKRRRAQLMEGDSLTFTCSIMEMTDVFIRTPDGIRLNTEDPNYLGVIGAVEDGNEETKSIFWKIPDMFSIRGADVNSFYTSLPANCSGSSWYLKIYPNSEGSEGFILLSIGSERSAPSTTMNCILGITNNCDATEVIIRDIEIPINVLEGPRLRFLEWSELERRKDELVPRGNMQIVCTIWEKFKDGFIRTSHGTRLNTMDPCYQGVIGEIKEGSDEMRSFFWTIPDIFSIRGAKVNSFYSSLPANCSGSSWYLKMYPNCVGSEGLIFLSIGREKSAPSTIVIWEIGIMDHNDATEVIRRQEQKERPHCEAKLMFLPWSELERRKDELVPKGNLTIICSVWERKYL